MPLNAETLKRYQNRVFVETGAGTGHGIRSALAAGFERVFSIEIDQEIHERVRAKFEGDERVSVIRGDSRRMLWPTLEAIDEPMTIWLDAHGKSGGDISHKPLLDELDAIARHPLKTHTILIDDWDYVAKQNRAVHLTEESVRAKLKAINPDYRLSRIDGWIIERPNPYWLVMVAEL